MRDPVPPLRPGKYKGGRNPEPSTPRPAPTLRPMGVPAWVIQKPEPPRPPKS